MRNEYEIINYRSDWKKFTFLEGIRVLEEGITKKVIEGKIVLLGEVGAFREYELLDQLYFTPLNERIAGRTFPDMSGVEVQANIVSMIKTGNYYSRMPEWMGLVIAFILCYANMLLFSYICYKNKTWFEISSLLVFVVESLVLLAVTVAVFESMRYQSTLTAALFIVAISIFAYQIYNESVKPFFIKVFKKA